MWGHGNPEKAQQKAGSRETEPSAGAAPAQGAASSTAPDASPVSARQVLAKFASYYRPYTFLFVFDLVCATVLACVDLAFPQFLSFFTKDFFQSSPEAIIGSLWWIALLFVVLYGVRTACQYLHPPAWGHIMGARMEADMRMDLFKQYQRLSFSYYDRNNTGEMMSKLVTDLFDISELAHHGPENLFICILKIVGSFALLFLINVPLTAIMLVATLLLAAYSFWRNYQKRVIFTENRKKMADINARLQDSLGGIRVVKSFGNEPVEIKKFDRTNARFVATKESSYRFMGSFHAVNSLFIGVLYTVTIVGGGYFVATGGLAVSDLAIYALYIGIFISPIEQLINFVETFQKGYAGFRRFMEVLAVRPDIADAPDAVDLGAAERARCGGPDGHVAGEVRYRDVHFSYDGVHGGAAAGLGTWPIPAARRWRSWGRREAARPPRARSCPASTIRSAARWRSTASISAPSPWSRCATPSASCSRTCTCSAAPSATTSPTGAPTPRRPRSWRRRSAPTSTHSCAGCPTATTPTWASAGLACPAGRSSASPSRACS